VVDEATTDQKIEQLVRSVLEAVDARLGAVRAEIAAFAEQTDQRHQLLVDTVATFSRRIDEAHATVTASAELSQLVTRLEAVLRQQGTVNDRLANVEAQLEAVRDQSGTPRLAREPIGPAVAAHRHLAPESHLAPEPHVAPEHEPAAPEMVEPDLSIGALLDLRPLFERNGPMRRNTTDPAVAALLASAEPEATPAPVVEPSTSSLSMPVVDLGPALQPIHIPRSRPLPQPLVIPDSADEEALTQPG
jgi:hypothetical protein